VQSLAQRLATPPSRPRPAEPVPVGLVITDLDVGGAEGALVALATGLDRARWEPSVVCLGPPGALIAPLHAAGIPTECLYARRSRPVQAVLRLARSLRRRRPRLVQSFLFHANIATRLAAPLAGRPWVLGGLRVAEREKAWHRHLDSWTQRLSAGSVCVSRGVERFSREVVGLDPGRLAVIPNGVDRCRFDRATPVPRSSIGVPDHVPVALFVGRIELQKGVSFLLDALAGGQVPPLHLVIVGDGPDRPALQAESEADPHLRDVVHWLGRRNDVPGLLASCDFLVLPSLWEGMPNVVLEAMAARRAVVATSVEGSEDLVVPGVTGWLVPPAAGEPLVAALREAVADPVRLRAFGEAGRERVEREFSQEAVVRAYDRLWSRVLGFAEDKLDPADPRGR
jgi:starch synthase (maltosyl-transferring)